MEFNNMSPKKGPLCRIKRMQNHRRTHFTPEGISGISTLRTPIVRIENHRTEVLSCEFHPSGKYVLSSNHRGEIHVCDIYGTFSKMMVMKGHSGPVTETHFSRDGFDVYSCSADGTLGIWDTFRGFRKARLEGHTSGVNCMSPAKIGYPLLCSGSNDGTVRIWDTRERNCAMTMDSCSDVTAVCFSELGEYVFSGGPNNDIKIWDIKRKEILYKLSGHEDKITGLALSPCGMYLLSHSVDNTLRIWDIRPYVTSDRGLRCFPSNQQGAEGLLRCSWSKDGSMISAGTAERDVFIWDADTGEKLYDLPGHESCINDVAFHPKEPIALSASDDRYLFLHELCNLET